MILQTLFLLKRYGNSTIFTRNIYNADNRVSYITCASIRTFYFDNVRRCDAIRYALGYTLIEDSSCAIIKFRKKKEKRRRKLKQRHKTVFLSE